MILWPTSLDFSTDSTSPLRCGSIWTNSTQGPMAEFHGFQCDACGRVWRTLDKRTKVTMRFEQTECCDLGSYSRDLCPNCIVEPFDWTPSKRNRNASQSQLVPDSAPEADIDSDTAFNRL